MEKDEKRFMMIGRSAAGKTTLCQRLYNQELRYHKTQTTHLFNRNMIDTPGEYLERRQYRGAITVTAADADILLFVQGATEPGTMFPPSYASGFVKPVIGVVTKCDLADREAVDRARQYLYMAGVEKIFETSSVSGEGVDALAEYLGITEPGE